MYTSFYKTPLDEINGKINHLLDKKSKIKERVYNGELYESQAELRYKPIDEELAKLEVKRQEIQYMMIAVGKVFAEAHNRAENKESEVK